MPVPMISTFLLVMAFHPCDGARKKNSVKHEAVVEFDYTQIMGDLSTDTNLLTGFLLPGLQYGRQMLSGEKTQEQVAKVMLKTVGSTWAAIGTMYNPVLGAAVSILFSFADNILKDKTKTPTLADQILSECDLLVSRAIFQDNLEENMNKLSDVTTSIKKLTSADDVVAKLKGYRNNLDISKSDFFDSDCVRSSGDKEVCQEWRRSGETLMNEIMFTYLYQSMTATLKHLNADGAYTSHPKAMLKEFVELISEHWKVYRQYSHDGNSFEHGSLRDTTRFGCQCTTWNYQPGKDLRLDVEMPWTATRYRSVRCAKQLCFMVHCKKQEYYDCKDNVEQKLVQNREDYMAAVKKQLANEVEPAVKELCVSVDGIWDSSTGCAMSSE